MATTMLLPRPLLSELAAAAGSGCEPDPVLAEHLLAALPNITERAVPPPAGHPYSRTTLHCENTVEVMVARWAPRAPCAPHDHGGSSGFVVALEGTFTETHYQWSGTDLVAAQSFPRSAGDIRGFGPRVIHAMVAGAGGGVTLHVYTPAPQRMKVYDLKRREILDLVGDFGAWIPDGQHPRIPFELAGEHPCPT